MVEHKPRILVVEDDAVIRDVMRDELEDPALSSTSPQTGKKNWTL
jgi:CheY-like chemotaxis protein